MTARRFHGARQSRRIRHRTIFPSTCFILNAVLFVCQRGVAAEPEDRISVTDSRTTSSLRARSDSPAAVDGVLSENLGQFKTVSSLQFAADVRILLFQNSEGCSAIHPNVKIDGWVRFLSSGERYRYQSYADPVRYPGIQTEVAYDGSELQILLSTGLLIVSSENHDTLLPTLPNPLFEWLQYAYPVDDARKDREPRWDRIHHDPMPAGIANVDWMSELDNGVPVLKAILPGGTHEGTPYQHCILMDARGPRAASVIERRSPVRMLTRSEFSNFQISETANMVSIWPKTIRLKAYADDGGLAVIMDYELYELTIDGSTRDEDFRIANSAASRVWIEPR